MLISRMSRLQTLLMLGLALLVAIILMSTRLDAPFDGGHIGLTGAWYSLAAHNFELYGPTQLYFCLSTSSGPLVEHPDFYLSHPAGISVWLYAVFSVFGEGEFQARVAALALSLGAVVFFFLFQRRLWRSNGLALFGTLLAVTAPVWSIYGSLIDPHGPGILFAMGGAMWATLRWHDTQKIGDLLLANFFVMLGCGFDWAACLVGGGIGLWALLALRDRALLARLSFWISGILMIGVLLLLANAAGSSSGRGFHLLSELLHRSSVSSHLPTPEGNQVTRLEAVVQVGIWHWKSFFLPMALLSWVVLALVLRSMFRRRLDVRVALILVPTFMGLMLVLFFFQAIFEHEYLQIYLAPGFAMLLCYAMARWIEDRPEQRRLILALATLLVIVCFSWAYYRAELRWSMDQESRADCKLAGQRIQDDTSLDQVVLSDFAFFAPIAWYGERRIVWLAGSERPIPEDAPIGGVLTRGPLSPALRAVVRREQLKGPVDLLGGKMQWYAR